MQHDAQPVHPLREALAPSRTLNPWLRLVMGIALVLAGALLWGWLGNLIPGAEKRARIIDERGLRATAIFYTDLAESAEGAEYIRHRLENPPVQSMPK